MLGVAGCHLLGQTQVRDGEECGSSVASIKVSLTQCVSAPLISVYMHALLAAGPSSGTKAQPAYSWGYPCCLYCRIALVLHFY